ncbi:hypothetical protein BC835DRAFT_1386932 [Cytidiella melzeri]|nr:hypothetical protein BC835DRAFT_1386932 [Cytidiella melzeri]
MQNSVAFFLLVLAIATNSPVLSAPLSQQTISLQRRGHGFSGNGHGDGLGDQAPHGSAASGPPSDLVGNLAKDLGFGFHVR